MLKRFRGLRPIWMEQVWQVLWCLWIIYKNVINNTSAVSLLFLTRVNIYIESKFFFSADPTDTHAVKHFFKVSPAKNGHQYRQMFKNSLLITQLACPSGRAVKGVGLRPLVCRGCGFESDREHGFWSIFTLCGPCIVLYLRDKDQKDAPFFS
jgi:hypothetical protein